VELRSEEVAVADTGSFRDPSGRIYHAGDRIFRTVNACAADDYEFVRSSGLIQRLQAAGMVIESKQVLPEVLGPVGKAARFVVEHPLLPFISYPYEWPFSALKAAALLHLDIHMRALAAGATLSDATAYNVQFLGARPIFIDLLSFRRYRPGEFWTGYRQFCEQFLNPLLLRSKLGVTHNAWYRGTQEGISAHDLRRLLPWRKKLSRNVLTHVVLQSALQISTSASKTRKAIGDAKFPLEAFQNMLASLNRWIESLEPAGTGKTVWQDYARSHSYSGEEAEAKRKFVTEFVSASKVSTIWDLGCNVGDYSKAALECGAKYAVGFDFDQGALELAFARAKSEEMKFQPVLSDFANPSPNQGWNEGERLGLSARAKGDAIIALALIHHLVIGKNIPLANAVNWLVALAPQGIIEFVPKNDPMVQELLALREDIFENYTEENFSNCLLTKAEIIESRTVTASGRKLFRFRRRA
jgi:ribosomal protein L11 methylase PrmA